MEDLCISAANVEVRERDEVELEASDDEYVLRGALKDRYGEERAERSERGYGLESEFEAEEDLWLHAEDVNSWAITRAIIAPVGEFIYVVLW